MKQKKILAYVVAGAMMLTIPVAAALTDPLPVRASVQAETTTTQQTTPPTSSVEPAVSGSTEESVAPIVPCGDSSSDSRSSSSKTKKAPAAQAVYNRAAEAMVLAARELGLPLDTILTAEAENKTVGEYMSNSIQELPGLEEVTPVAQGGNVILDGMASNVTFSLDKPLAAHIDYAKAQAETLNGTVMNVVNVKTTASFETATVNFYMPGVVAGQNIQVFRYVNGEWESVSVAEIREDHVVVDMTAPGVLAFVEIQ